MAITPAVDASLIFAPARGNAKWLPAILSGANLSGANLEGAVLEGVNLAGANLRNAKLQGADLRAADLRNVDFTRAERTCRSPNWRERIRPVRLDSMRNRLA